MEIIRKKTTLKNLNFTVLLTSNIKNLGLIEDLSEDISTIDEINVLNSIGSSKLSLVRSFDFNNPYKVGVNGVIDVQGDDVEYKIGDLIYKTNIITQETIVHLTKTDKIYNKNNFVRNDNRIGLADKIATDNDVNIERPILSIIENFSKLQQITNPDELVGFANNFYKVYDQTL